MSQSRKVLYLFLIFVVIFYTPYIALYIKNGKIPDEFFRFPATEARDKPPFNMVAVVITSTLFIAYFLIIFFPRIFGFRRTVVNKTETQKKKLPLWFWIGLILWGSIMFLFTIKSAEPKWLINWALLPLWWGFILMLDGIVYARSGGRSLAKDAPAELIAMGMLSISGWLIFEYFNFFINLNWYYPAASLMHHDEFLLYAVVGSSAFIPMAFEWYHLLRTFPALRNRYTLGKKVTYSLRTKLILLTIAFGLLVGLSFAPESLFYAVWLAPLAIIVIVLSLLKIWTPFTPIMQGNWTPLILFSTVWVLQGFCVEWWNHLSCGNPLIPPTNNPGYWNYCIPFVNFGHIFNMPILGYLGYVPFGIYCFIWVVGMGFLMNIKFQFTLDENR